MSTVIPICERCGEPLITKRVVWLELSQTDGNYYSVKTHYNKVNHIVLKRHIPEDHISQGVFPFGSTCAKKQLKENEILNTED